MVRALAPPLGALAANSDILASAPSIRPMAATLPGVEGLDLISASVAIIDARVSGMLFFLQMDFRSQRCPEGARETGIYMSSW